MLVVGDKEVAASTVSVRLRDEKQLILQPFADFKVSLVNIIKDRMKGLKLS